MKSQPIDSRQFIFQFIKQTLFPASAANVEVRAAMPSHSFPMAWEMCGKMGRLVKRDLFFDNFFGLLQVNEEFDVDSLRRHLSWVMWV